MERKEDTPVRKTRRKYEEKNKEKRKQASGNFGTMIPRALYDEINAFLEENGITKVRLIKEGYEALKNMKKDGMKCAEGDRKELIVHPGKETVPHLPGCRFCECDD